MAKNNIKIMNWRVPICLERCNFLTATVSTPANSLARTLLLLWDLETLGDFTRLYQFKGACYKKRMWAIINTLILFSFLIFGKLYASKGARTVLKNTIIS